MEETIVGREITAGVWIPCFGEKGKFGIVGTNKQGVALVSGENENTKLWNTQLIAAAPELLDALEEVLTILNDDGYPEDLSYVRNAKQAIAKARGEEV